MKGKIIDTDGRNIILKVLHFFEQEKANNQMTYPLDQVTKRTCAATGISKSTLMNIKKEAKQLVQQDSSPDGSKSNQTKKSELLLPPRKKRKPSSKKIVLSNLELIAVRHIVNSFNIEKKEVPTLNKILAIAQRDLNFRGQRSTLRRILIDELGFKFKRNNARALSMKKQKKSMNLEQ